MKMISFVKFNPRHIMFLKIIVIILILALVLPKVFFLVKEAISPWISPEDPFDTQKVGKTVEGRAEDSGLIENMWFHLLDFYRHGINIFI